jgi:amidohydrolase
MPPPTAPLASTPSLPTEPHLFAQLESIAADAVAIRHDLHRHPQIGYQEVYAREVVCKELTRLGIEHRAGLAGGTGVVGLIHGKAEGKNDRCVALRADMDALPIMEATGAAYASMNPGVMHACGHDGHMAVLLGAAAVLSAHAKRFSGTIKLLFQPAEEGGLGAKRMCEEGVLESPKVEAIFGLHGWPGLKVGMVATRPEALLASVDGFTITVTGRGGHAAAPQTCVDPIVCAAAIVGALQTIVSREADPTDACVVTVAQIQAGSAFNIIPDRAELSGTIRALSKARREATVASIERIGRGIAAAYRCEFGIQYFGTTPTTTNTPALAEFVRQTAMAALGERSFVWAPKPAMWGEDFAFYLERVPGCFFVLGVQPHDRESYPMLHNPAYDFTDAAVPIGIRMMTEVALRFLNQAGV